MSDKYIWQVLQVLLKHRNIRQHTSSTPSIISCDDQGISHIRPERKHYPSNMRTSDTEPEGFEEAVYVTYLFVFCRN